MASGHRVVVLDELYSEIARSISHEVKDIEASVDEAANMVTKELLSDIRDDSPVRTGVYKKGWKRKKLTYVYTVYNKTKPSLTHLLEYGHVCKTGKREGSEAQKEGIESKTRKKYVSKKPVKERVEPIEHIKKNEERAVEKFENLCIDIVSAGLRLK